MEREPRDGAPLSGNDDCEDACVDVVLMDVQAFAVSCSMMLSRQIADYVSHVCILVGSGPQAFGPEHQPQSAHRTHTVVVP